MMRRSLFLFILLFNIPYLQALQCKEIFPQDSIKTFLWLEEPREDELIFDQILISQKDDKNSEVQFQQQTFLSWIEIPSSMAAIRSYVALDKDGRLFSIMHEIEQNQQIARLLSGQLKIKQFFIIYNSILMAIDSKNRILFFSPQKWTKKPLNGLIQGGLATAAATTGSTLLMFHFFPELFLLKSLLITSLTARSATVLNTVWLLLSRYNRLKKYPDGFVNSKLKFTKIEDLDQILANVSMSTWKKLSLTEINETIIFSENTPQ